MVARKELVVSLDVWCDVAVCEDSHLDDDRGADLVHAVIERRVGFRPEADAHREHLFWPPDKADHRRCYWIDLDPPLRELLAPMNDLLPCRRGDQLKGCELWRDACCSSGRVDLRRFFGRVDLEVERDALVRRELFHRFRSIETLAAEHSRGHRMFQ